MSANEKPIALGHEPGAEPVEPPRREAKDSTPATIDSASPVPQKSGSEESPPGQSTTRERLVYEERTHTLFHGPLPHPELLGQYNALIADGANRIFGVFEAQAHHRMAMEKADHELDKLEIEADIRLARRGLDYGLVVALAFLAAAVFLVTIGQPIPGTVLGSLDIVALVTAFIRGSNRRREQEEGEEASTDSPSPQPPLHT